MEMEVTMGRRERGEGGCRGDGGREQVEFREKRRRKRKRKGIEKEQSDRGRKGDGVNMWHAQQGAILELT